MPDVGTLNSPTVISSIERGAREAAEFGDREGSIQLLKAMRLILKQPNLDPEARSRYEGALRDVFVGAMPILSDKDVLDGIEKYGPLLLGIEYLDFLSRLKQKLMGFEILEDRDEFKGKLRNVLLGTNGTISSPIPTPTGTQEGSIRNWLLYYTREVAAPTDTVARAKVVSSGMITSLVDAERTRVRKLFEIFDFLRSSSFTGKGFEGDLVVTIPGDKLLILNNGVVNQVDLKKDEMINEILMPIQNVLKQSWAVQASEPTELEKQANAMSSSMDILVAQQKMGEVLAGKGTKDQKEDLAVLYAAVKGGVASMLEKMNFALQTAVKADGEGQQRAAIIAAQRTSPEVFKLFLQTVFSRLGFTEGHAVALAGRLIPNLKPDDREKYLQVAYYDFDDGTFKWS